MNNSSITLKQVPLPGSHRVEYAGSVLTISLELSHARPGKAFLRTNLGGVKAHRAETIDFYELGRNPLGRDWRDIEMRQVSPTRFELILPLNEIGRFEFKTYFRKEGDTRNLAFWVEGENVVVKIEPAVTYAANSIYNAFVRQFGKNIEKRVARPELDKAEKLLNEAEYTVIPPSGTFRDLKNRLDFIIKQMGFNIIQLLPVHPAPTTYARMGRFGSPFAPLDFFSVDSSMANFDRSCTPMAQFQELIDEIHGRNAMVFLDLPADHTGWASVMQTEHPEWFRRNDDGSFESPGAWGTIWADLVKLDFNHRDLWDYLAKVFLHWCTLGVDGFRCDAGYMIPADAWNYIVTKVRSQFEDTIFFLEGLGGGIDATDKLLTFSGMDWAYSELFQNYSKDQISEYLAHATAFSTNCGTLVHFAETHDNDRLAKVSKHWAKMRTIMAAIFAPAGCYGIANGVEWYATEKIDVHGDSSLNWGANDNMVKLLTRLNSMLAHHPAFSGQAKVHIPVGAGGNAVGVIRETENPQDSVLAIVNPDEKQPATYEWNFQEFNPGTHGAIDLLTGQNIPCHRTQCTFVVRLEPGQALCLAVHNPEQRACATMTTCQWQLLRSTVLRFIVATHGYGDLGDTDVDSLAESLYSNPIDFIKAIQMNDKYLPIVEWYPQRDEHKVTPIPAGHMLLVYSEKPFRASIFVKGVCVQRLLSCSRSNGRWFALFSPLQAQNYDVEAELRLNVFFDTKGHRTSSNLLLLGNGREYDSIDYRLEGRQLSERRCALSVSRLGSYSLLRAAWGTLFSAYDAIFAANLNPEMPVDRRVILSICQLWVRYHGFAQKVSVDCQTDFSVLPSGAVRWYFTVPIGMGRNIYLAVLSHLDHETGNLKLTITQRRPPEEDANAMADDTPVDIGIRPYLENRTNHHVTKAGRGAEHAYPQAIKAGDNNFAFDLRDGNFFVMSSDNAEFMNKPKWEYGVYYPLEASRNLEAHGDIFSPGVFRADLHRGESCVIYGRIQKNAQVEKVVEKSADVDESECPNLHLSLEKAMRRAVGDFVADRNGLKTVIAGYPWFLDWGRDTLICLRGLLDAGFSEQCADIIALFASYENKGTIPNMICGNDTSNRDTSDAPLWLILATKSYIEHTGDKEFMHRKCGDRQLLEIIGSILDHYKSGTPNGIKMDPESGLIFSPAHFTWMDTNYPACTPREGYPVEIQALWIMALKLVGAYSKDEEYDALAKKATESLTRYYVSGKFTGFSDCLHCQGFQPAAKAVADDHCRPNQLFLVTLGVITDGELRSHIIQACHGLVVPGALRTLADAPVSYALPIFKNGQPLNDPKNPYWGYYEGDEDTRRKPAYHNGTAWPWLLPTYCEAVYMTYGESAKNAALAWLTTVMSSFKAGCLGHIPEIVDGNWPHRQRGCTAQAWSATEAYRVFKLLKSKQKG